ncbi:hypothetical protein HJG60_008446 [Phyllostomus discolor]|uniref:Uncharacterized protein n=1 Tax=Phyllostomus discolor TaxID=89673 RepID=A0A833Z8F6_9CHIR|nr:hypothetical protein HJG60_008446 [Phyllostomus discolor]
MKTPAMKPKDASATLVKAQGVGKGLVASSSAAGARSLALGFLNSLPEILVPRDRGPRDNRVFSSTAPHPMGPRKLLFTLVMSLSLSRQSQCAVYEAMGADPVSKEGLSNPPASGVPISSRSPFSLLSMKERKSPQSRGLTTDP